MITDEDLRVIQYFWEEKGDLTRWAHWEEKLPLLREKYPELVYAWEDHVKAEVLLNFIVKELR